MFDAKHAVIAYNHIQLEKQILQEMADKFQKRIDFDLMVNLIYDRWTKVELPGYTSIQHEKYVHQWVKKHCRKSTYDFNDTTFVFKFRKNAEWFILRWL
jgi:hypothetical protein